MKNLINPKRKHKPLHVSKTKQKSVVSTFLLDAELAADLIRCANQAVRCLMINTDLNQKL